MVKQIIWVPSGLAKENIQDTPRRIQTSLSNYSPCLANCNRKACLLSRAHELVHLPNVSQSPRILDATSMTFSSGPTMAVGRSGCAVAGLDERRVLVAGGFDGCRSATLRWDKVQHWQMGCWESLKAPNAPNQEFGQHRTSGPSDVEGHPRAKDGYTTILGWIHSQWVSCVFFWNLFSQRLASGNQLRCVSSGNACAAVRLDAKRLLIIGGSDDSSELDSTELLDLERPWHAMKDASLRIWFLFKVYMVVISNWYVDKAQQYVLK